MPITRLSVLAIALVVALVVALAGCSTSQIPTLRDYGDSAIGQHIDVVREVVERQSSYARTIGWQETAYPLANGHWVYVEPDRPNCEIHYEVDEHDIIVGYTVLGSGCADQ